MATSTAYYFVNAMGCATAEDRGEPAPANSSFWPRRTAIAELLAVKGDPAREKLQRAIRRAIDERARTVVMAGDPQAERRMITVRPAREDGHAVVTCVDLDAGVAQLTPSDVIELFALSPAEAEIAIMLTRGASLAEVADRRGVQQETVRGQVKTLLRKVGVGNQKQLAAIMAQVGAALLDIPAGLVAGA